MEEEASGNNIFELKKWNAVAVWSWNTNIDHCAICKQFLSEPSPLCMANPQAAENCRVVWGECNHPFHYHCIQRWIETKNTCPLCSRPWSAARYGL